MQQQQQVMWMVLLLFRWFCWVHSAPAGDNLLSPKGVNYEVAALMSVKREMRDDRHVMDGWDINSVDPCTWSMVACSPEGSLSHWKWPARGYQECFHPALGI